LTYKLVPSGFVLFALTMLERSSIVTNMNRLDVATRKQIVAALVEGNSIRATCRMTGAAKGTVLKLLNDLGEACDEYQDKAIRNLSVRLVQCDEIWSFCYCKDKTLKGAVAAPDGAGSAWTWTAIDPESKLILTWYVGDREAISANRFMLDLASRIDGHVQLTTDGLKAYQWAIGLAFENGTVDYGRLIKLFGGMIEGKSSGGRYSPAVCTGVKYEAVIGNPEMDEICTSHVERQNLTMRMSMRRFTRLTNGHSKKIENHEHAIALHFMHYNFCRAHETLKQGRTKRTPAMAAGIADHIWTLDDVIGLLPEKTGRFQKIGATA
jgi:IS1 family transposase